MELNADETTARTINPRKADVGGKPFILIICGSLVYYHCAYRNSSLVSLVSDVFIVLLCSLAILGLLFRQMNISVPVDPLEWQISQDAANSVFACLANTIGAAESVLRVAATGHDKRLFFKVVVTLYVLSALGRIASGVTIAYAGLCFLCLYMLAENLQLISSRNPRRRDCTNTVQDD
ncbi:PREDICTED: reticulon-like protein B22 [Nicotiana attenuata]|uniref:Reticulon-like protein b22 n=1 Tax=Nicotiana attenuata TaxID=49451 RepID=A0A1J6JX14_NICAT|nr:PREDICTED: reticulon-like protein B22 [Nicotiana attenuata]OIT22298.1 reticulon-like protein b22 [Nicotiana attenuata]